jgi:hypothetical protein
MDCRPEKIKNDFDQIALFEKEAVWTHNSHYHQAAEN